jgi:hypothetical protein
VRWLLLTAIALVAHIAGVPTHAARVGAEEGGFRGVAIAPSFGGSQPFPPVTGRVFRVYSEGRLIRTVRTDAHGRFATRLPAGWYAIRHPDTASDRIYTSPARFLIRPRETTRLTIAVTWTPLAAIRRGGTGV